MRSRSNDVVLTTLTWFLVLLFFFPIFWMFLNGFKPEAKASTTDPVFFFTPVLDGYRAAMDRGIPTYMRNSAIAAIGSTLIIVLLAFPGAYALSIRRIKKVDDAMFFFISTRFMPVAAAILPIYMILKSVGRAGQHLPAHPDLRQHQPPDRRLDDAVLPDGGARRDHRGAPASTAPDSSGR